ncbi:hypothetical protein [Candidatus Nitrospira bockiana]
MPLATIREQLKTVLQQADPGSLVHDYERWTNDPASLNALFKPGGETHLRAWIFKPVSLREFHYTQDALLTVYEFLLRFVYSLVDSEATEKQAWTIVEAVRQAVREHPLLNTDRISTSPQEGPIAGAAGLQVEKMELLTLGGVLCHYAELRLGIHEVTPYPCT